jgi:hypothetical protein
MMSLAELFRKKASDDAPTAVIPAFPLKSGKTDHYMMAHVVLPFVTFHRPDVLQAIWSGEGPTVLCEIWRNQQAHWGVAGEVDMSLDVTVYVSDTGSQAAVVTFPRPHEVPEAHGVIITVWPQRRYFVVELAHPSHIARHAQRGWVFLGNDVPRTAPTAVRGYLCEWCADGARFNYGLEDWAIPGILDVCLPGSRQWTSGGTWPGESAPLRPDVLPLDAAMAALVQAEYQGILTSDLSPLERATQLRSVLNDAVRRYGRDYTEITLIMRDIVRLYVHGGDVDMARSLATSWVNFSHKYRGSRSPEVRLAYLAQAYVAQYDTSISAEQRTAWIHGRLAISERHAATMRTDWPGANHTDFQLTAADLFSSVDV